MVVPVLTTSTQSNPIQSPKNTQTGIKTLENAPESKRANEKQAETLNIKCLDCSEEGACVVRGSGSGGWHDHLWWRAGRLGRFDLDRAVDPIHHIHPSIHTH